MDIDKFLSFLKEGEEKEEDIRGALSLHVEAMEQYRGDFLPEDLYCQWIEIKREEFKGRYIDLIHKIAKLYEKERHTGKQLLFIKRLFRKIPC